jgi:hypothetical protein
MFPSAYNFIVCWFSLSFTTCFGLHGHLQVCRIFHMLKGFWFAVYFFFFHVVTLCMFSICVLFLRRFPSCFFVFLFPCVCKQTNTHARKQQQQQNTKENMQSVTTWKKKIQRTKKAALPPTLDALCSSSLRSSPTSDTSVQISSLAPCSQTLLACVPTVIINLIQRPNKRWMRTYHWISLSKSYISQQISL